MDYISKLEVTNNINNDVRVEWKFFDSVSDREKWIAEMKKEEDDWNYKTEGAISFRNYEFYNYNSENILDMDMSEFSGMLFRDFLSILKGMSK